MTAMVDKDKNERRPDKDDKFGKPSPAPKPTAKPKKKRVR